MTKVNWRKFTVPFGTSFSVLRHDGKQETPKYVCDLCKAYRFSDDYETEHSELCKRFRQLETRVHELETSS